MTHRSASTALASFLLFFAFLFPSSSAGAAKLTVIEGDRFILDLRYNSENNFLKQNVYKEFGLNQCRALRRIKQGLLRIEPELRKRKLKLVLFDCYRPLSVQKKMWKIKPEPGYVADPAKGSNHNRGIALDVTLAREDGTRLPMPTEFDDFTPKAHRKYKCSKDEAEKCDNRKLLESLMKDAGLKGLPTEWWHFQIPEAFTHPERFRILNAR
jgi:D-alanyl-D-alanine dipeptidase